MNDYRKQVGNGIKEKRQAAKLAFGCLPSFKYKKEKSYLYCVYSVIVAININNQ